MPACPDIVRAVTAAPAALLRRPDLADLSIGSTGDATVMRLDEGRFTFSDVSGQTRMGRQRFALDSVVVGGKPWHAAHAREGGGEEVQPGGQGACCR